MGQSTPARGSSSSSRLGWRASCAARATRRLYPSLSCSRGVSMARCRNPAHKSSGLMRMRCCKCSAAPRDSPLYDASTLDGQSLSLTVKRCKCMDKSTALSIAVGSRRRSGFDSQLSKPCAANRQSLLQRCVLAFGVELHPPVRCKTPSRRRASSWRTGMSWGLCGHVSVSSCAAPTRESK